MSVRPLPFLRLVLGRRGRGLRGLLPVAVGLTLPCLALLSAASFLQATDAQSNLARHRDGSGGGGDLPEAATRGEVVRRTRTVRTSVGPVVVTTFGGPDAAALGLPGLDRLPETGTVLASPAVGETDAASELQAVLPGPVNGRVPNELLARPDERVVVAVVDPAEILATRDFSIMTPGKLARAPRGGSESRLFAAVMALGIALPSIAACATAVRVSATRRDHRYATLRLVGVSPRIVRSVVAGECAAAGLVAAGSVIVFYHALLGTRSQVTVAGWSAWANDLRVAPIISATVAGAVTFIGASVAAAASRRVTFDPVATRQRIDALSVRIGRSAWLLAAIAIPCLVIVTSPSDVLRLTGIVASLVLGAVGVARCIPLALRRAAFSLRNVHPATFVACEPMRRRAHESARPALGIAMVVFALAIVSTVAPALRDVPEPAGPADLEVRSFGAPVGPLADTLSAVPGVLATAVISSEVMALDDTSSARSIDVAVAATCADAITFLDLELSAGSCFTGSLLVSDEEGLTGPNGERRLSADPLAALSPPSTLTRAWPQSATFAAGPSAPGAVVIDPSITTALQTVFVETDRGSRTLAAVERLASVELPSAQLTDRDAEAADRERAARRAESLIIAMTVGLLAIGSLSTTYAGWGTFLEGRPALRVLRTVGFPPRAAAASVGTAYAVPLLAAVVLALATGLAIGALTTLATGGEVDLPIAELAVSLAVGSVPALVAGGVLTSAARRVHPDPPRPA